MFSNQKDAQKPGVASASANGQAGGPAIQVEGEVGGEMTVGGKLVIGEKGVVNANVQTVDAIIKGSYQGNMIATGNVEITDTGRVTGNITTDSLVISKGGFFNGNVTKMNDASNGQRP